MTTKPAGITLPTQTPASAQVGGIKYSGKATFGNALAVTVVLPAAEADNNYRVLLGPLANKTFWITNKLVGQFTINASALSTDDIDWALLYH